MRPWQVLVFWFRMLPWRHIWEFSIFMAEFFIFVFISALFSSPKTKARLMLGMVLFKVFNTEFCKSSDVVTGSSKSIETFLKTHTFPSLSVHIKRRRNKCIYHLHVFHVGSVLFSSILFLFKFDEISTWLLVFKKLFDVICVMCYVVYAWWLRGMSCPIFSKLVGNVWFMAVACGCLFWILCYHSW